MISIIPHIVTTLNLVFGMIAIMFAFANDFFYGAVFVMCAMLADMMDGRVARMLKVSSEFGKELDSLCDLVSFGVAPAILAYNFMLKDLGIVGAAAAIAFATCGALRLARFNVNTGIVKGYFMGLPIPGGGCVLATFVMIGYKPAEWVFLAMVLVFGYLMVSTIRYPDFKGKGEKIRPIPVVITLAIAAGLLYQVQGSIFFVPYFSYVLFGILNTSFRVFEPKPAA